MSETSEPYYPIPPDEPYTGLPVEWGTEPDDDDRDEEPDNDDDA